MPTGIESADDKDMGGLLDELSDRLEVIVEGEGFIRLPDELWIGPQQVALLSIAGVVVVRLSKIRSPWLSICCAKFEMVYVRANINKDANSDSGGEES